MTIGKPVQKLSNLARGGNPTVDKQAVSKRISTRIVWYGVFLIASGLIGFLSNPEKAKTALMSGGLFGSICIALGRIAARGWRHALPVSVGLASFLAAVFIWRSSVSWGDYLAGQPDKLFAAILISTMLVGSLLAIVRLLNRRAKMLFRDESEM